MSTWLTIKISRGLTELRRTQARRNAIVKINYHNKLPDKQQNENLLDKIIRNLSDEARIAVMLLFELDKNSRGKK
ncbi:MAG: hypothetical protein KatS3mg087_1212 [Patescibacteria group bacterium]|nr:MAG: hypothetical protein KatS3mg087_1212 [Patescibacteria group bacterium]